MANANTPTLQEIIQLTRSELTLLKDDEIEQCGRACMALLPCDPDMCLRIAYQHLHDVPYKEVKRCWRRLYVDAALRLALAVLERRNASREGRHGAPEEEQEGKERGREDEEDDWVTKLVEILDMALILTGAPGREELVELWFSALGGALEKGQVERPAKRRKLNSMPSHNHLLSSSTDTRQIVKTFPSTIKTPPTLLYPIPRAANLSLEAFQNKISNMDTQTPVVIEGAIGHWPALHERPWHKPEYLLEKTLGGRRLVPVEIGRSYTDEGWGQRILSFGEFVAGYMGCNADMIESNNPNDDANGDTLHRKQEEDDPREATSGSSASQPNPPQTGYLAQHDLFAQIPSLRADISIPDYCYADPSPNSQSNVNPVPKLEEPLLNAWFGPASTISPLHTDPYHNILAQVVGYKYVRLYAPCETGKLYPRSADEDGIDMSNTSEVDLDLAMAVWPEISCWEGDSAGGNGQDRQSSKVRGEGRGVHAMDEEDKSCWEQRYAEFKEARYVEGVLGPGESLYVPVGWWHYVRSLTPSFSGHGKGYGDAAQNMTLTLTLMPISKADIKHTSLGLP